MSFLKAIKWLKCVFINMVHGFVTLLKEMFILIMKSVKSSLLGLDIIILLSKDSDTKHKDRRPWDIVNDDESYESFVRDRLLE